MARWAASLALEMPVVFLYIAHYLASARRGLVPTGFIQYDMPYYMACAREFFDAGHFAWSYGNPFSAFYETPAIYVQPFVFILGVIYKTTGLDPGVIFVVTGLIAGTLTIYLAIVLFDRQFGLNTLGKKVALCCFVWGGGLLALAGAFVTWLKGGSLAVMLFRVDPFDGWWFLNFGRNLVYPTEAFYHLLVLALVLQLLKRRYAWSAAILALLSISHPFTGLQFILIVLTWLVVERCWFVGRGVPVLAILAVSSLGVLHVAYYLVFLPSFPEHGSVMEQWTLPWLLEIKNILPAYALVTGLVAWRWWHSASFDRLTGDPASRLLIVWFLVSLLLAKHELFITPRQPLHFTRGYIWSPLFLLGAPVLIRWVDSMSRQLLPARALIAVVLVVFLADNALWFALRMHFAGVEGIYATASEMDALRWMNAEAPPDALVVSDDRQLMYLATVYTPLRSWVSHSANTPFADRRKAEMKRYVDAGVEPIEWHERNLVVIRQGVPHVLWRHR